MLLCEQVYIYAFQVHGHVLFIHTYKQAANAGSTKSQRDLKKMCHIRGIAYCRCTPRLVLCGCRPTNHPVTRSSLPVWTVPLASRHHAVYFNLKTLQRISHAHINRLFGSTGKDGASYCRWFLMQHDVVTAASLFHLFQQFSSVDKTWGTSLRLEVDQRVRHLCISRTNIR